MFGNKRYIFNKLKEIGIDDNIIKKLYKEKITEEEIRSIVTSNYPYDIARLFINKHFRDLKIYKNQIIGFIDGCEENYQAYYASMAATNKDVLENEKVLSIVYNISRAKKFENAKLAYKIGVDKHILDSGYSGIATAMASNGMKEDKIYSFVESDIHDTQSKEKIKRLSKK